MKEQGRKLMAMISTAVNGLTRLDNQHYDTVATALVRTLGQGLGEAFTPQVKDAWVETYGVLAKTMKDAAATVEA